jgi:hypothetical protein
VRIVSQKIEDILDSLRHLEVDWRDETASQVIAKLQALPVKAQYSIDDVRALLDAPYAMAEQFERDLRQLKSEGAL